MANLKKVLAGSLSLCLAASMFTACGNTDSSSTSGNTDSSSTSDKNGGSTSKAGNNTGINNSSDRVNTAELHGVDSSEDSKKTLTIYCWNTEFSLTPLIVAISLEPSASSLYVSSFDVPCG